MTASRTWKYEKSTQNNMKTSNFVYIITLYIVCFILYQFSAKAASKAAGSPSLARLVLNNYLWEWNRILVLKILHFVLVIFNQVYDWRYENYKVFFFKFLQFFYGFLPHKKKNWQRTNSKQPQRDFESEHELLKWLKVGEQGGKSWACKIFRSLTLTNL